MSKNELYDLLKPYHIDLKDFYELLKIPDKDKYRQYKISYKNKDRLIEEPLDSRLIIIQKQLSHFFEDKYYKYKPSPVHGFVNGRDIKTNALEHYKVKYKYLLKIDIKDFFNSISYERLYSLFKRTFNIFSSNTINALCLQVTCHKHLPQGSSCSPILSNMICKRMDKLLLRYSKSIGCVYTRYADDMTFSIPSMESLLYFLVNPNKTNDCYVFNPYFRQLIEGNGFLINDNKTKLVKNNSIKYVCGVSISNNNHLSVRRLFLLKLRHDLHHQKINNLDITANLIGRVSHLRFINGIDSQLAIKYSMVANSLGTPVFIDSDFIYGRSYSYARKKYLVYIDLDNGGFGTGFFANGFLITSAHVIEQNDQKDTYDKERYLGIIKFCYHDKNFKKQTKTVIVSELYINNEIAFIKFDGISVFNYKYLKLGGKIELPENHAVLVMGARNYLQKQSKNIPLVAEAKVVLDNKVDFLGTSVYSISENSIYKGMSGGPLISLTDYKVYGVNYIGVNPGEQTEDYPRNYCSKINKHIFSSKHKVF